MFLRASALKTNCPAMTDFQNIRREVRNDGLCVLTFDRSESVANLFDTRTFEELNAHLDFLEDRTQHGPIQGVIFISAKGKIFIAGADLHGFTSGPMTDERLGGIIDNGHRTFNRIAALSVPTVAAIQGVCVGGGLELTLACDWRVACNDAGTKLGLPEVQIGILPAWGGSVRLPRLVGLPKALEIILTGKQLAGVPALKCGLVDALAYPEGMLSVAEDMVKRGKRPPAKMIPANLPGARQVVAAVARRNALAKTRGNYPAAPHAIEVATAALGASEEAGFRLEREAFVELAKTDAARNLMGIFFLQERAKKTKLPGDLTPDPTLPAKPLKKVAVVGAGLMGAGIAQWSAGRGLKVLLKDISPAALAKGMQSISKVFADAAKRRVFTKADAQAGYDRVVPVSGDVPLRDVDLVIEAAVERLDLKREIFAKLEAQTVPGTVLATNTSALSIDTIADNLQRPGSVVGIHFFNPVHRMQLVEIVRGERTDANALNTALGYVKSIGKRPVIVKDAPGFLVNRVLLPYMSEALRLTFEDGYGAERLDRLMLAFGMPMGPLRLLDEVGVDVGNHVARDLTRRLPGSMPPDGGAGAMLGSMIQQGWLGRKADKGIYLYGAGQKDEALPPLNPELASAHPRRTRAGHDEDFIAKEDALLRDRMVLVMVNEAARVLEEGVVGAPEDVDFGLIMGTGWAPFRGGPLRYADKRGLPEIVHRLDELARLAGPHFQPCKKLRDLADHGGSFYAAQSVPVAPGQTSDTTLDAEAKVYVEQAEPPGIVPDETPLPSSQSAPDTGETKFAPAAASEPSAEANTNAQDTTPATMAAPSLSSDAPPGGESLAAAKTSQPRPGRKSPTRGARPVKRPR